VVVPVADFLRLRALERLASAQELEDARGRRGAAGVEDAGGSRPDLLRGRRRSTAAAGPDQVSLRVSYEEKAINQAARVPR